MKHCKTKLCWISCLGLKAAGLNQTFPELEKPDQVLADQGLVALQDPVLVDHCLAILQ